MTETAAVFVGIVVVVVLVLEQKLSATTRTGATANNYSFRYGAARQNERLLQIERTEELAIVIPAKAGIQSFQNTRGRQSLPATTNPKACGPLLFEAMKKETERSRAIAALSAQPKRARSARSTWVERALLRTLSAGSNQASGFSQLFLG